MFDKSGLRCSVGCLEVSGMGGLSLDGVGNEVSAREWTEASGVTRGQRGVNGASIECEGSEWALGDGSCRTGGDVAGEKTEASLWSPQPG